MSQTTESLSYLHSQIQPLAKNIRTITLQNGLQCVLYKDTSKPKVLVQLAYNVGSSSERSDEKGLAHLVEHMIFKGTQRLAEGDIDAIARKFGAQFNAYTSHDITSYYFEVNKSSWKYFLDILADCMNNSRFDEQHLASELKAVVQELNMYKDNLDAKLVEKALELSFPANHPYHFPVIGFKEELAKLSAEQLHDFYKRNYYPSKAALFIVGDINFDEVEAQVQGLFGSIKNNPIQIAPSFPPFQSSVESINVSIYEEVEQEKVCFFWKTPGLDKVSTALVDVFSELFAGGASSRIYRAFVDETEVARDISFQADLMHRAGIMLLFVLPASKDFSEARALLLSEINRILKDGFLEDEISRVKTRLALSFIRKTENWNGLVDDFMNEIFLGGKVERVFDYLAELETVSKESLLEFFSRYFSDICLNSISLRSLPVQLKQIWHENLEIVKKQEEAILANHVRTTPLEEPVEVHKLEKPGFFTFEFPIPEVAQSSKTGIELLCYKKTAYPITYFKLNFKNSFILNKDKEGLLVGLMMEMLLEKSKNYTKYQNLEFLESLGAHFSFDSDGLSLSCLPGTFELALNRMLEIFCNPVFEIVHLEKQKEILLADLLERSDDPQSVGIHAFYKNCYAGTGMAWDHLEAIAIVKKITVDDLAACHAKYCNAGSFFVAVSGLFDQTNIINMLDNVFESRQGGSIEIEPSIGKSLATDISVEMMRDQVTLLLARPSTLGLNDPDYFPLSILNIIIFYSLGSRLYKIREQQGLFYSIFGGFALDASIENSLDYVCTLLNLENVEHAKSEILKELNKVKDEGITEEELSDAKQIYLGSLINLFSDTPAVTQVMISLKLFNRNFDYYKKILNRLKDLTVADINLVAKKYITTEEFSTITVGKK